MPYDFCAVCNKILYPTRPTAHRVIALSRTTRYHRERRRRTRMNEGRGKSEVFRCKLGQGFHIGHKGHTFGFHLKLKEQHV